MFSLHTLLVAAALVGAEPLPAADRSSSPSTQSSDDVAKLREALQRRGSTHEQGPAALLLLQAGTPEAREVVLDGLRRLDRPDVFLACNVALRNRPDVAYLPWILRALASDQPGIRQIAQETLSRWPTAQVVGPLQSLSEDTTAGLVPRQAALAALGRCVHKSAVPPLLRQLQSDVPALRGAAVSALQELTGLTYGNDPQPWLAWWQQHTQTTDDAWLTARAAYFAERSKRLTADLQHAEAHILQLHQTLYLKISTNDRVSHLQSLAKSEFVAVRMQAINWVTESFNDGELLDQRRLTDLLLQMSGDGEESVQRQAILALEKRLSDPRVLDRLVALMGDGNVAVRAASARSLGRFRGSLENRGYTTKVLQALEKGLADESLQVVAESAESLGATGTPEAGAALAKLLGHGSDPVRQAAARALEQIADPTMLEAVITGMNDPSPGVRFSLVGGLGRIAARPEAPLATRNEVNRRLQSAVLRDSDAGVRSRAATILGDVGSQTDLAFLWQRATATEDNRVQQKAWSAFLEILARSGNVGLALQWDQTMQGQREFARRIEMLVELRARWQRIESMRNEVDAISSALVQAHLTQRKWSAALPLALELARRAPNEPELQRRIRWLLIAGNQGVDERRSKEVLQFLKEADDILARAGGDLSYEFQVLKKRAATTGDQ